MKKIVFGFLLGIIVTGISVYALTYNASDIAYKNGSVADALDTLYQESDFFSNFDVNDIENNNSYGEKIMGRKTSLNLKAGEYIIVGTASQTALGSATDNNISYSTSTPVLKAPTGSCVSIFNPRLRSVGTEKIADNKFLYEYIYTRFWKCSFSSESVVELSGINDSVDNLKNISTVSISSIKVK